VSICSSGSSTTKPGVASSVVVDQQYVQSILPPALAFLFPYIPYMQGLVIGDVGAFCAADPPTFTMPSASDFLAFVSGGNFSAYTVVNDFMQKVVQAYIWGQLCQCTAGGTFPPPTAPTDPGNLPAVNPPSVVTGPVAVVCEHQDSPVVSLATSGHKSLLGTVASDGSMALGLPLPIGAATVVYTVTRTDGATPDSSTSFNVLFGDTTTHTTFGAALHSQIGSALQVFTQPIPAGAKYFAVGGIHDHVGTWTNTMQVSVDIYCGGGPGQTQQPCCPPDPSLNGRLNLILDAVTLLQRQLAPFAYISSTAHAGLSGAGSIAVQGLLGVKVDVTTIPTPLGREGTNPTEYFDMGFITFGTADGWPTSLRIDHSPALLMPPRASVYTDLEYDLHPGVVVTITELLREP
jgi:hypothetical protein